MQNLADIECQVKKKSNDDVIAKAMHTKANGAILPEVIYKTDSIIKIGRDLLIKLLQRENQIRLSDEMKEKFDKLNEDMRLYRELDRELRRQTLKEFNFDPDNDDSFKAYQLACGKYINDPEIREKVVWMKYDKTRNGKLKVGDDMITEGIYVYDLNLNKIPFKELIIDDKVNIVISGSIS